MARSFAVAVTEELAKQETDQVFLELIQIDEASLPEPIRAVNNPENVTSNGDVYASAGFGINLAGESENEVETVRLRVDNVDRLLVDAVRAAVGIPTVILRIVRADDPDVFLVDMKFNVETANTTAAAIEAVLTYDNAVNIRWPRHQVSPVTFPAGPFG